MHDLYASDRYRQIGKLVLDARTRHEFRIGHVPDARNIPVDTLAKDPARFSRDLLAFDQVFIHCSSGKRAQRAHEALARTGLRNLVVVDEGGMSDWAKAGYPVERSVSLKRDLLTGLAAGLVAQVATAGMERLLRPRISTPQKIRERLVRQGSPHEVGGKRIGAKLLGRRLSRDEQQKAQAGFSIAYGLLWGAIYALARRRLPKAGAALGLPFAGAFFLACDGLLAPLFRMTPGLQHIPWQFNAKELANHVAWTATAETVHRVAERLPR